MKRLLFVVLACAISSPSYALYISYMPVVDFSSFADALSFTDSQSSYPESSTTDASSDEPVALATTTTTANDLARCERNYVRDRLQCGAIA